MNLPLAIKEQEGVAGSFEEAGSLLTGLLCPTVYRCPNCREVYKVILGPGDVFLGEGHRTCSKCQQAFRDRSQEWLALSSLDRFFLLFPGAVCGWVLLGSIGGVLFYWTGWILGEDVPLVLPVAIIFATPLIVWFMFRGFQVARSIHRFNLHGRAKAV